MSPRAWRIRRRTAAEHADWAGEGFALLVGHARSGTTVLARALGSHPEIGYWEEPALVELLVQQSRRIDKLARHLLADSSVKDLSATRRDGNLREQFAEQIHITRADVVATRNRALRASAESLRRDFLRRSGGSILLEKTPREVVLLPEAIALFPEARIIHIVRDGRDVVCSGVAWQERWGRPPWVPEDGELIVTIAHQWAEQVGRALQTASDRVLVVRYEDLVVHGGDVVAACLSHLGLEPTTEVNRFLETGMGGLHCESVGRWRNELTASQLAVIDEVMSPTLLSAGYAPT